MKSLALKLCLTFLIASSSAFGSTFTSGEACANLKYRAGKLIEAIDAEIARRMAPFVVPADSPVSLFEKVLQLKDSLRPGADSTLSPLQRELLAKAEAAGVRIEISTVNQAHEKLPWVWLNKADIERDLGLASGIARHELAHVIHHTRHLSTTTPELIFLREVDAHLFGTARGQADAVMMTLTYYPHVAAQLSRYQSTSGPLEPVAFLRAIRSQFPQYAADFQLAYQ